MSKPEEFLKKIAAGIVELSKDPEAFEAMKRESERSYQEFPPDLDADAVLALGIAKAMAAQAFVPLREELGRDGEEERFQLFTHFIRQNPSEEHARSAAEELGMTVDEFRERVAFMNERLEFHFRAVVAEANEPEYVEEETKYLMSLLDTFVDRKKTP